MIMSNVILVSLIHALTLIDMGCLDHVCCDCSEFGEFIRNCYSKPLNATSGESNCTLMPSIADLL